MDRQMTNTFVGIDETNFILFKCNNWI